MRTPTTNTHADSIKQCQLTWLFSGPILRYEALEA